MKIILASASPRRKELMEKVGFEIEIRPSGADENIEFTGDVPAFVEALAEIKGSDIETGSDEIVVSADTVVAVGDRILGKPRDPAEAADMLRLLSGRTHSVYTGVCVRLGGEKRIFFAKTDVEFYELSEEEIADYVASGEPFDKAGGYGIQGYGCFLVKGISGDYSNVVGLPAARVYREIRELEKKYEH